MSCPVHSTHQKEKSSKTWGVLQKFGYTKPHSDTNTSAPPTKPDAHGSIQIL